MSLIEELLPASYKGVEFLVGRSSVSGGQKDVAHQYPNSNRQTIEDLGARTRSFTIDAIITGDNYIQDRDRLLSALEEGGIGKLVHPLYGDLEDIKARSFTLIENFTELGDGKISIVFERSDEVGIPKKAKNTVSGISRANAVFLAQLRKNIAENYKVTTSATGNFNAAVDKVNDVIDGVVDSTKIVQASADKINAFNAEIGALSANVTSLVLAPQNLADSVTNLFSTVNGLFASTEATLSSLSGIPDQDSVKNTIAVFSALYTFGDNDVEILPSTFGLAERESNNDILNQSVQTMALSYSYLNASQIDFNTVEDIDQIAGDLELQYLKVIDADGLADDTKSLLTDLRTVTQQLFDEERLTAKQIIAVDTNLTSARLMSFRYYGDSTQSDEIIDLNKPDNVSFIEDSVRITTA